MWNSLKFIHVGRNTPVEYQNESAGRQLTQLLYYALDSQSVDPA